MRSLLAFICFASVAFVLVSGAGWSFPSEGNGFSTDITLDPQSTSAFRNGKAFFDGVVTFKRIDRQTDGSFTALVDLVGSLKQGSTSAPVNVANQTLPLDITGRHGSKRQAGSCSILNLDLGPLHLDLLGLVVDLNEVVLNIVAQSGAGNLLGNLLCAVAGLLDGVNLGGLLSGLLGQIGDLINQILGAL